MYRHNPFPSVEPELKGTLGRAWQFDRPAILAKHPSNVPPELTLETWAVHAAYAHPLWHSYVIALISLRDMPGAPECKMYLAGATHEIFVYALDPEHPIDLQDKPKLLIPCNFSAQFIAESDAAAEKRVRETVQMVIDGVLNPDTDYSRHWQHLYGTSNVIGDPKTAGETRIVVTAADGSTTETVIPPQPGPQDLN